MSATRILIVEDEAVVAMDLERRLRKSGYEVSATASTAEQALTSIEQTPPDLVLMDIHLEHSSDGIEAAREVHRLHQIPVVFLTAYADQATLERALAAEPFSYLIKPVGTANLTTTIELSLHKHRAERELKNREAWLQTVLGSMADAVLVADAAGAVQFLNPAAERLSGWSRQRATGEKTVEVFHLVDCADRNLADRLDESVRSGTALEFPRGTRLITLEGAWIDVEGQVAFSSSNGHPAGVVITLQNVTARNFEEAQIRQEQKMTVASRLANGIAHDFNRQLEVILRHSDELTRESSENSKVHQRVKAIHRAAQSIAVLTGQVLGLCRSRSAQPRVLDLNSLVNRMLPMLSRAAGASVQVETDLHPQAGTIHADIKQMEQVLLNLVLNAKDVMPGGGRVSIGTGNVELPVRTPRDSRSEPFVRLTVQDNGPGMYPEVAEHMFEPFFTSKRARTGTGLGLALVYSIVTACDGFIHAESKPGEGSRLEIFLPRWEAKREAARFARQGS
jgi:PAS domain S-box-containing protein